MRLLLHMSIFCFTDGLICINPVSETILFVNTVTFSRILRTTVSMLLRHIRSHPKVYNPIETSRA